MNPYSAPLAISRAACPAKAKAPAANSRNANSRIEYPPDFTYPEALGQKRFTVESVNPL